MAKENFKEMLHEAEERMARVSRRLEEMSGDINSLPTPEPIPSGQKSTIDFKKLAQYPLHYSPELLARIAELDTPREIEGSEKKAMAELIELIQNPFKPDEETLRMIEEMKIPDETEED